MLYTNRLDYVRLDLGKIRSVLIDYVRLEWFVGLEALAAHQCNQEWNENVIVFASTCMNNRIIE